MREDKPTLRQLLNTLGYGSSLIIIDEGGNGKTYFNGYYDHAAQDEYLKKYDSQTVEDINIYQGTTYLIWTTNKSDVLSESKK